MSVIFDRSFSQDWESISQIIKGNSRFLITTHVNADPDALGSELSFSEGLRSIGKQPVILNPTRISRHYSFLDQRNEVKEFANEDVRTFDAAFILDISRWERLGSLANPLQDFNKPRICIDHHPYTGGFTDLHLVNVNACASAEIVYDLLSFLGIPLNQRIAECLYISIL